MCKASLFHAFDSTKASKQTSLNQWLLIAYVSVIVFTLGSCFWQTIFASTHSKQGEHVRLVQKATEETTQDTAVMCSHPCFSTIYQLFPQDQWVKILQVKYSPGRRVSSFACSKSLHPWHSSIVSPGQEFDITGTPQKACTTLKLGFGISIFHHVRDVFFIRGMILPQMIFLLTDSLLFVLSYQRSYSFFHVKFAVIGFEPCAFWHSTILWSSRKEIHLSEKYVELCDEEPTSQDWHPLFS